MRPSVRATICVALLALLGSLVGSAGQKTGPVTPLLVIDSMYGPDLYRSYCATCHGRDGKGNGPVAAGLESAAD
jgi:cytochrome c